MKLKEIVIFVWISGEGGQTLAQVAHRSCEVSLSADIQNPTGHSTEQLSNFSKIVYKRDISILNQWEESTVFMFVAIFLPFFF